MFDGDAASDNGRREVAEFLATVPLLEGVPRAKLEELATGPAPPRAPGGRGPVARGRRGPGDAAARRRARVSVSLSLPGDRTVEVTTVGPGEVLGEVPLLDGGQHSATVRVIEPTTLLSLSRADFAALVSGRHPTRIRAQAAHRGRRVLAGCASNSQVLAASLGGEAADAARAAAGRARVLRAARQRVRAALRDVPRVRLARAVGIPDRRAASHAARPASTLVAEGAVVPGLLPDDQRRGREGHRPRRPPHPRRARRSRSGVRIREPDRRRAVARDRRHARADAPAGAAARRRSSGSSTARRTSRTCSSTSSTAT